MSEPGSGLTVEGLSVRYGAALAVDGVSFAVPAGSVLAILGANGAGKSSVARACAGLVPPAGGKVSIGDTDITGRAPDEIRREGLVYLPEIRGVFPNMTVNENVRMASRLTRNPRAALEAAYEHFPALSTRRNQRAGSLSGGEQQMLSMARAVIGDPRVVIVDEPSMGLAPLVVEQVFRTLENAKKTGVTMVLIEQFVHRALALADNCVIMRQGKVSWSGGASEASDVLSAHYLGSDDDGENDMAESITE